VKTEPLYKKVGRKYVPVQAYWHEDSASDQMAVGTFRLVYAYADGGRRYEYEVKPDTAGFMAAAMIAKAAMEDSIRAMSTMQPSGVFRYNKAQLKCIEKFHRDMDGLAPTHWMQAPSHEIVDAGIKAVLEFKP